MNDFSGTRHASIGPWLAPAVAIVLAAVGPGSSCAAEWGPGTTVLAVQAFQGPADFLSPSPSLSGTELVARNELGGQLQVWRYVSARWALCFSVAATFSNEKLTVPAPFDLELETSTHSLRFRGGLDRMVPLADDFVLFAGAGIEYVTSDAKNNQSGLSPDPIETSANRYAFSGRLGSHIQLGSHLGLVGQIGYYAGYATADQGGLEARWWPSGTDAAGGMTWVFGGGSGQ